MKILIINSVCNQGSTGIISYNLHKHAESLGIESLFCYGRGQKKYKKGTLRINSRIGFLFHVLFARITGLQGYFSIFETKKLCKIIGSYNPDVIYLGNLHGYYLCELQLLNYIKSKEIKTVYIMFDEYPYMGKCAYSGNCEKYKNECIGCPKVKEYPKSWFFDKSTKIFWDKYNVYEGFKNLVFLSVPYNIEKAKKSFLLGDKHLLPLGWGIDIRNTFVPKEVESLREKLNISKETKVILNVAPYSDERKGVKKFFVEIAKALLNENIIFINVGFNGNKNECPANFLGVEYIRDQKELAEYFSLADLTMITSMDDTYPTVALDSIACGTPVCGFNKSGIPYVAPAPICTCKDNIEDLITYITEHTQKTRYMISLCRAYAEENYDEILVNDKILNIHH